MSGGLNDDGYGGEGLAVFREGARQRMKKIS